VRFVNQVAGPYVKKNIGMGYVPTEFAKAGTVIEIEARGKRAPAIVVTTPILIRS